MPLEIGKGTLPQPCNFCHKMPMGLDDQQIGVLDQSAFICKDCLLLGLDLITTNSLNLRPAYFSFILVAKLLSPVAWAAKQLKFSN
jgi:hypothetical protein